MGEENLIVDTVDNFKHQGRVKKRHRNMLRKQNRELENYHDYTKDTHHISRQVRISEHSHQLIRRASKERHSTMSKFIDRMIYRLLELGFIETSVPCIQCNHVNKVKFRSMIENSGDDLSKACYE